jgi:transmembrane sensor
MLRREAARWLARLQSERDPDVRRKFERWRADPRHAAAFERVNRTYQQAGLLRHSPALGPTQQAPAIPRGRPQLRPALAAAAAAAVLVPVAAVLVRGGAFPFRGTDAVMLATGVGEIRQFDLADGSRVTLDTATKVDIEIGRHRRSAHLRHGRARFQVARAAVPFVIETAGSTASTRGGVIDVERIGEEGRVQVLAGNADVSGAGPAQGPHVAIGAGEGVTVGQDGAGQKDVLAAGPDWTRGMLQFDGTPLAQAVALANRYSDRHILVSRDLNALQVTGAFRAGDTAGLAEALAAAFGLSLQHRSDGDLILSRGAPPGQHNKHGG